MRRRLGPVVAAALVAGATWSVFGGAGAQTPPTTATVIDCIDEQGNVVACPTTTGPTTTPPPTHIVIDCLDELGRIVACPTTTTTRATTTTSGPSPTAPPARVVGEPLSRTG